MTRRICSRRVFVAITRDGRATLSLRHQLEQDFEVATNDYENINAALKADLPRYMVLATQFIDPLFKSYFYMQYVEKHGR